MLIAFDKERLHSVSQSRILDYLFMDTNLAPPKNYSGAKLFRASDVISIEHVLCS